MLCPAWTIDEFHRIASVLPERRLELIRGELREMTPKGTRHAVIVNSLAERLPAIARPLGHCCRFEAPLRLEDSEPEPDVAIVQGPLSNYWQSHPTAAETRLVIEVADSSLDYDCGTKLALYRDRGIGHYWVIDCQQLRLLPLLGDAAELPYRDEVLTVLRDLGAAAAE